MLLYGEFMATIFCLKNKWCSQIRPTYRVKVKPLCELYILIEDLTNKTNRVKRATACSAVIFVLCCVPEKNNVLHSFFSPGERDVMKDRLDCHFLCLLCFCKHSALAHICDPWSPVHLRPRTAHHLSLELDLVMWWVVCFCRKTEQVTQMKKKKKMQKQNTIILNISVHVTM